jgi:hypothetical protein
MHAITSTVVATNLDAIVIITINFVVMAIANIMTRS